MKIAIGCDHAGFNLKGGIIKHLEERGFEVKDFGTFTTESVNYPDFALKVCMAVKNEGYDKGILICGTGVGMSMAANKIKGIRAALCGDTFSARATRQHNDANVLCIGERVTGPGLALDIVDLFVDTKFEGGRHQKRIDLFMNFENL